MPVKADKMPVVPVKMPPKESILPPVLNVNRRITPLPPVQEDFLLPERQIKKHYAPTKPRPSDMPPLRKQFDLIKKADEYLPPVVRPPHPRNIRRSRKYSYPEHHKNRSYYDRLPVLF
jgi:hypothetical protein